MKKKNNKKKTKNQKMMDQRMKVKKREGLETENPANKQQKMVKPLMIVAVIALLFVIGGVAVYVSGSTLSFGGDYVSIEVINGSNGNMIILDNQEEIQAFIDEVNQMAFERSGKSEITMGYTYHVNFYKKNGRMDSFTVMDTNLVKNGRWQYQSQGNIIECIAPMFEV